MILVRSVSKHEVKVLYQFGMFTSQFYAPYICTRWCKHWILVYWAWCTAHWWNKTLLLLLVPW